MSFRSTGAVILFFSLFGCVQSDCQETFQPGNYIHLKNITLFNSETGELFEQYAILIKDDIIYQVGPDSVVCAPADAKVFELEGELVTPGLFESHGHQVFNESFDSTAIKFKRLLQGGVTSIRNMAGRVPSYVDWNNKIHSGEVEGPRRQFAQMD